MKPFEPGTDEYMKGTIQEAMENAKLANIRLFVLQQRYPALYAEVLARLGVAISGFVPDVSKSK